MKKGGKGGGNTITGLIYEAKVDLESFLNQQDGYLVNGSFVYFQGQLIARIFKKYGLYKYLEDVFPILNHHQFAYLPFLSIILLIIFQPLGHNLLPQL